MAVWLEKNEKGIEWQEMGQGWAFVPGEEISRKAQSTKNNGLWQNLPSMQLKASMLPTLIFSGWTAIENVTWRWHIEDGGFTEEQVLLKAHIWMSPSAVVPLRIRFCFMSNPILFYAATIKVGERMFVQECLCSWLLSLIHNLACCLNWATAQLFKGKDRFLCDVCILFNLKW